MQLTPGTWREMRAAHGLGTDPYDPRDNILAGTAYLRFMYERFGYPGLFAAYNAGPQRYAELLAIGRRLPAETVSYVAAIAPMRMRSLGPAEKAGSAGVFVPLSISRPARIEAALQPAPPGSMFVRLSASSAQSR